MYINRIVKNWNAERTKIKKTEHNIQGLQDNYNSVTYA